MPVIGDNYQCIAYMYFISFVNLFFPLLFIFNTFIDVYYICFCLFHVYFDFKVIYMNNKPVCILGEGRFIELVPGPQDVLTRRERFIQSPDRC